MGSGVCACCGQSYPLVVVLKYGGGVQGYTENLDIPK